MQLEDRIAAALGRRVESTGRLSGGCVADVVRVDLEGGDSVVVKHGGADYLTEALMLRTLAERSNLPVPRVLHAEPDLLVIDFIESDGSDGSGGASAERHAADLLADLHGVSADAFGFEQDTLIGPLRQPCPPSPSWVEFFAEHRLRHFGRLARERGAISDSCWAGLRRFADRLSDFLDEPDHPALIHGDVWGGNVLCRGGRIAAFIDPAVHHAHPEVELAFITLFSTFGREFFDRYAERRPIAPGFFETRCHVYNLYPLLVHAILFGGGYGRQVEASLARVGGP